MTPRFGVSPSPDEENQNLAFIVDGAPEPIALAPDDDHHLVEVPVITGLRAGPPQIGGDDSAKLQDPPADGPIADVQAPLGEHLFHIAENQVEPGVQSDRLAGDFGREAVLLGRELAHRSGPKPKSHTSQPS